MQKILFDYFFNNYRLLITKIPEIGGKKFQHPKLNKKGKIDLLIDFEANIVTVNYKHFLIMGPRSKEFKLIFFIVLRQFFAELQPVKNR